MCNGMTVLYTLLSLETAGSFTVLEHKTRRLWLLSNMLHIYVSSFTIIKIHKCSYSCIKY